MVRALLLGIAAPLLTLALLASSGRAAGTSAWYEGFEDSQTTWGPAESNVRYRIAQQERVQGQAHTGRGCELLRFSAETGTELFFRHEVGQPYLIPDFMPTVWIRANRPGMYLTLRVVLPRTTDPQTGRPMSVLLRGSGYTTPDRWQQLRIDDANAQLTHQTWTLRKQLGPTVDPREAYVEALLLNVYGGPGDTTVLIDDLDLAGYVNRAPAAAASGNPAGTPATGTAATPAPAYGRLPGVSAPPPNRRKIELSGQLLRGDGKLVCPRAIQYQGEPLGLLQELGFNVIWLSRVPTAEMMAEATQRGLWLVSPPPRPGEGDPAAPLRLGAAYDCVLAWNLGHGLPVEQVQAIQDWADQVRGVDELGRPFICQPTSGLKPYSNIAPLLLIGRAPLGSSLELKDYGTWVRQRPWLAVPGTPTWTTIQTQPDPLLRQQWRAAGVEEPLPNRFTSEQIRLLVYTSVTAGSRGLLFESFSSLAETDPETRARAMTLELLNLELELIEPWMVAGSFDTTLRGTVNGKESGVVASLLQSGRARLLVPVWTEPGAQFVSGQAAGNGVSFLVPAIPEGSEAYEVLPGRMHALRADKKAGGTPVTLEEFSLTSLVLFTQDAQVSRDMAERTRRIGLRAARLQRDLAALTLQQVEPMQGRLPLREPFKAVAPQWLATAHKELQTCDQLLAAKPDPREVYLHAERAMRPLRLLQRENWEAALSGLHSPVAAATAVCWATLPAHLRFLERLNGAALGENRLPGGDFEDVSVMVQSGWRRFQTPHPPEGVEVEANLVTAAAHGGRHGLVLRAMPSNPKAPPTLVESPLTWMTSPAVSVQAGEIVCIQGWVQIATPITGSVDGLLIVDSLGGEPLAERIGETVGWKPFTLYRVAPSTGSLSVTFALSGLGEACLDDVRICPVAARSGPAMPLSQGVQLPGMVPPAAARPSPGSAAPVDRSRLAPLQRPHTPGPPGR